MAASLMRDPGSVGKRLHETGPHRLLEGGDGTRSVGKGDLEMSEDVRRRSCRTIGGQFGWRVSIAENRADVALGFDEASPVTLPSPVTQRALDGTNGGSHAAGGGTLEELPQTTGGHTQPSDFVGDPNAERSAATATGMTIAAKNPPSADGRSPGTATVVSTQPAMANQHTDDLAVRAGRLLEPLPNDVPFLDVAIKPTLPTHVRTMPHKNSDYKGAG